MKGKRSLILQPRYAVPLAALAIFCGPAASAAPVEAATAMCFEHIGPQDKPMPGFCVSGPDDAGRPQALHLDDAGWRRLVRLVRQEARQQLAEGRVAEFGLYALRLHPSGRVLYASPLAMRSLTALLGSATGLNPDDAQMLQRLRARLAPPRSGDS